MCWPWIMVVTNVRVFVASVEIRAEGSRNMDPHGSRHEVDFYAVLGVRQSSDSRVGSDDNQVFFADPGASSGKETVVFDKRLYRSNSGTHLRFPGRATRFVACAICLRVQHDGAWVEAGDAIRLLRTFERKDVVRLREALCERCETELWQRRRESSRELAA
jgi:hypothetical protein